MYNIHYILYILQSIFTHLLCANLSLYLLTWMMNRYYIMLFTSNLNPFTSHKHFITVSLSIHFGVNFNGCKASNLHLNTFNTYWHAYTCKYKIKYNILFQISKTHECIFYIHNKPKLMPLFKYTFLHS